MQEDRQQQNIPSVLSIAGSDPSGGAGLQLDLRVLQHFAVHAMGIVSLHTVQNSSGVLRVKEVDKDLIREQLRTLLVDIRPSVIKIGALASTAQIELLAEELVETEIPLVLDPIIASTSGKEFLCQDGIDYLKKRLLPLSYLITPNLEEAEKLADVKIAEADSLERAAKTLLNLGAKNVLIKGGHAKDSFACDILFSKEACRTFKTPRIENGHNVRGTGCALSSAISAGLALGYSLSDSVFNAKEFLQAAIISAKVLGKGAKILDLVG